MTFLDTSVIIDFLVGDEKIVALVEELIEKNDIKTTTITEYELLRYKVKIKKNAAERFLQGVTIYPFDRNSARKAASLYEMLREDGKMINENDLLIAGISYANDDVLLTRDQKFAAIANLNIKMV